MKRKVFVKKRIAAFLAAVVMCVGLLPATGVPVLAEPETGRLPDGVKPLGELVTAINAAISSGENKLELECDYKYDYAETTNEGTPIGADDLIIDSDGFILDLKGHVISGTYTESNSCSYGIGARYGMTLTIIDTAPETEHKGIVKSDGIWKWEHDISDSDTGEEMPLYGGIITGFIGGAIQAAHGGKINIGDETSAGGTVAGCDQEPSICSTGENSCVTIKDARICYGDTTGLLAQDHGKIVLKDGSTVDNNVGCAVQVVDKGSFNMEGGIITNNRTAGMTDAAISCMGDGVVNITNGSITENKGRTCGAIMLFQSGTVDISADGDDKVEIKNNEATGTEEGLGGGITLLLGGSITMHGNVIFGNNVSNWWGNADLLWFGNNGPDGIVSASELSAESDINYNFYRASGTVVPTTGVLTENYSNCNPGVGVDEFFHYMGSGDTTKNYYAILNEAGEIEVVDAGDDAIYDIEFNIQHGQIKSNMTKAKEGAALELWVEPQTGYELSSFKIDGTDVSIGPVYTRYQFVMPDHDITVEAVCEHTHGSWQYSATENVLTATCGNSCPAEQPYSVDLALEAEDAEYDGHPHGASFEADSLAAWTGEGLEPPQISYATKGGVGVDGVPSDIGDYVATVTAGEATASIGYSITEPAAPQKKDYSGKKELEATVGAIAGNSVCVALPDKPADAVFGTPVKGNAADKYTLSEVKNDLTSDDYKNGYVKVTSEGIPDDVVSMTFQVPVTGSAEYNDYSIMVTLKVTREEPVGEYVTVTFDTNGGTPVPEPQTIEKRTACKRPAVDPAKDGFVFAGWYADATLTNPYNFDMHIDRDITIFAKWQKVYKMKEGKDQIINIALGKDAVFSSEAPYDEFKYIRVDGEKVVKSNYTVKSGSTVITLKAAYLKTLKEGDHTLRIVSKGGFAECKFTIENKAVKTDTSTGDANSTLPWVVLMVVALAAVATVLVRRRVRK